MSPRRRCVVLLCVAIGAFCCGTASAASPSAKRIASAMRSVKAASGYRAQIYGVWRKGKLVAIGADGSSQAGVPATPRMHFRAGNSGESMLVTALYRLAEKGKVRLSTPVSRWYPQLPNASSVTLRMLADSLSGYNDFVTTEPFVINYFGDPFRLWSVPELLGYAFSKPPLFAPGTSWAFSDTNFVLLGDIVGRIAHEPSEKAIKQLVLDPLGLNHTRLSPFADLPSPVLHAYTTQRDVYEDSTFWSTSVGRGAFDIYSTVRDLGEWARQRAKGTLLKPASRRKFFAPDTAGLGPMTPQHFFASATIRDSGWIFNNPQISGYTVFVADHVPSDTSVVVVATANPANNPSAHFATLGFQRLAQLLTPRHVPQLNPCPRGC